MATINDPESPRPRLKKGGVCNRYDVSRPTANRMIVDGRLPKPHYLFGRAYWWEDELEEHDEQHTETYDQHVAKLREGASKETQQNKNERLRKENAVPRSNYKCKR